MNKEQQEQLQFLGLFGILKESNKIILSNPKIFTNITLAFILPFNLFAIIILGIYKFIYTKILIYDSFTLDKVSNYYSYKWVLLYIFQATCFISAFQFSLLLITAVIYTAACTYTSKSNEVITFKRVLTVSLKVQKRLVRTMVIHSTLTYVIVLNMSFAVGISCFLLIDGLSSDVKAAISIVTIVTVSFLFVGGLLIIMFTYWKLPNVVTVMENYHGFKAIERNKDLIQGKIETSVAISLMLVLCSTPILSLGIQYIGTIDVNVGFGMKFVYGFVCLGLNPLVMLYGLVVQTIFYFVCKSYHHESIDDFMLTDHFDASKANVGFVPLKNEDVEIDRLNV